MLKWPNLYYATSAFAPKYLPEEILHYANTRGADRVIYAGYWPTLSFDDIFAQLDELQLRPHVWPKFLYENAARVFRLPCTL
jgi:predicted TIM-barrel fold metal-dependent hydrolase